MNQSPPTPPPIPLPGPLTGQEEARQYGPLGPAQGSASQELPFNNINHAWELLRANIASWMAAYAMFLVIGASASFFIDRWLADSGTTYLEQWLWWLWGSYLQTLITQYFWGGLFRMAVNNVRHGRADLADFFCVHDVLPALLGAGIVLPLAMGLGFMLCILPGIAVAALTMFVLPLIVDKDMGFIEATKLSYHTLKPNLLNAGVFVTLMFFLSIAGLALCGVGLLVTAPLAILTTAVWYCECFGE